MDTQNSVESTSIVEEPKTPSNQDSEVAEKLTVPTEVRVVNVEGEVVRTEKLNYNPFRLKFMMKRSLSKKANFLNFAVLDYAKLDVDEKEFEKNKKEATRKMLSAAKSIDMVEYQDAVLNANLEVLRVTFALNVTFDEIHPEDMENLVDFIVQEDLLKVRKDIEAAKKKNATKF